ncbi:rhodopsin-like [Penaeus monodon]|uniref:rhodopsin-like n=1 Tax=Penaeus monodon TaxID=6687 RepID=UPI0018A75D5B|nr:rhodopsin-like [Penaeus monodon]
MMPVSYLYIYSVWVYIFPLFYIIYSYTFIVKAVAAHEKGMREQAKKMEVKSLRSEEAQKTSAECRLCKVALMTVTLWFMAWTPTSSSTGEACSTSPWLLLFSPSGAPSSPRPTRLQPHRVRHSHPKYRAALEKKLPCLACATEGRDGVVLMPNLCLRTRLYTQIDGVAMGSPIGPS